ncbi:MAG TPA: magnesium-translocating P-type ATPase [Gemmatimonadaceae bacterium]|nr:magnesium-translocating P-type ATPase [Gemmatimonadaceae bacterium]
MTATAVSPRISGPSAPAGLTSEDARVALGRYGPNELATAPRFGIARHLLGTLGSPLMVILLVASGLAALVGETTDATIILVTVALGAALDTVQTARSMTAAERLQQSVVPTASVMRDGAWRELPRREVVPGDLIRLSAGDVVPADARLVTSRDLRVQQAALTGESYPAEKESADPALPPAPPSSDPARPDLVFLGTSVVSGVATAIVIATATQTAFGEIAARLRERPPVTELERGLQRFSMLLARTVIFLVLFLVLASITMHRDPLDSLLFAVALAVGIVPEFMPMITSITLANGAVRMSRQRVIVKHLAAIQNFGSIDVLCSDKTGTLTAGQMTLVASVDPCGSASDAPLLYGGLTARFQSGVANPLDAAILARAPAAEEWEKLRELPFDFERRQMSVVARRGTRAVLIVKGAPESVLAACTHRWTGDGTPPLDATVRARARAVVAEYSRQGLRSLAVAMRDVAPDAACTPADERDLSLVGFLLFADPPLADVGATIDALARDGVQLKIVTGDDDAVARYVCEAAGLAAPTVVLGSELEQISDAALGPVAERTSLFARVTPNQKLRIILALKGRGHVVGYVGDGINDAPSLHAADVGISVAGAVDVAKDASDVILLERGLGALHNGIVEGRKAFGNVMKYILMGTSSNFGNMFSMAFASLLVPFLPMLPTQVLLNNFLYDASQIAIPGDHVDAAYIRKPHHWDVGGLRQFMVRVGLVSSVFDFLTFGVLLGVFHASERLFQTGWFVESMLTQILVLFVIRTMGNPLRSRPSRALAATVVVAALCAMWLPISPMAGALGFVPLPPPFLCFVGAATALYLGAVELVKRRLVPRLG